MFLSKTILTALTLAGFSTSVNAAVLNTRTSPPRSRSGRPGEDLPALPANAICTVTEHVLFNSYSIWIGIPYEGLSACDNTLHWLENSWVFVSNWQCVAAKDGNIQLGFNTPSDGQQAYGDKINSALESNWPTLGAFSCPNY